MSSENKLFYTSTVIYIYLLLGGIISFVNLIFDLPYSQWVYNNMPVWLAGCVLAISSLFFFIGAFPPEERTIVSNLLLYSLFVTTFLIIKPTYKLAPQYMKIIFNISLWFYAVVQLGFYNKKRREKRKGRKTNKEKGTVVLAQ